MTLPTADWLAALAEMDGVVAAALGGLEAYEARWADAPDPTPAAVPVAVPSIAWGDRLLAAARLGENLERELTDAAAAAGRWGETFAAWRGRIEQSA